MCRLWIFGKGLVLGAFWFGEHPNFKDIRTFSRTTVGEYVELDTSFGSSSFKSDMLGHAEAERPGDCAGSLQEEEVVTQHHTMTDCFSLFPLSWLSALC